MTPATIRGLVLFAHGARDPRWAEPFQEVERRVRQLRPGAPVQLAFLEFMAPSLPQASDRLVAEGCQHIDVVPLFLGTGGHVRKDLPALLNAVRAAHQGVVVQLHASIGEADAVVQAIAAVAAAAVAREASTDAA